MTNTGNANLVRTANRRADQLLAGTGQDLATMTPEMYRAVRAQLAREGLWHGGRA
jgi:hypothetical protein